MAIMAGAAKTLHISNGSRCRSNRQGSESFETMNLYRLDTAINQLPAELRDEAEFAEVADGFHRWLRW